jgi:hypothetical protein
VAPFSLPLLAKDNNWSNSLTAHSLTLKFGEFFGLLLNMSLIATSSACIVKWVTMNNHWQVLSMMPNFITS